MKIFFSTLFFLIGLIFQAQNIEWKATEKLSWSDFGASIRSNQGSSVAFAYTGILYEVNRSSNPEGEISISIKNIFDKNKSWKKYEDPGNYILQHEQLHFDITEFFARKMRKMVQNKIKKSKDYQKYFQKEYKRIYSDYVKFQNQYDKETQHSINKIKQEEYNLMIPKLLKELEAFQKP